MTSYLCMSRFGLACARLLTGWLFLGGTAMAGGDALPKEIKVNNVEFVLVPEGWFFKTGGVAQGSKEAGGNKKIWLDAYYIGKYEARAKDLEPFLNKGNDRIRALYGGNVESCSLRLGVSGQYVLVPTEADLPATHLSWTLADQWARWMGMRLPTEAEWEKAARGGDHRMYPWGNEAPDETYANFNTSSNCLVWPVNRLSKGQSPYGALNMAGNVREFVADWRNPDFDRQLPDGARNPVAPRNGASGKILKGGRWASTPETIRISARIVAAPDEPFQCNGTRFALDTAVVRAQLANGNAVVVTP